MSAGAFARTSYSSGVSFGVSSLMRTRYPPADAGNRRAGGWPAVVGGTALGVFFFFSNRLGCLGSILISAVGTLILLLLLGVINLD